MSAQLRLRGRLNALQAGSVLLHEAPAASCNCFCCGQANHHLQHTDHSQLRLLKGSKCTAKLSSLGLPT